MQGLVEAQLSVEPFEPADLLWVEEGQWVEGPKGHPLVLIVRSVVLSR